MRNSANYDGDAGWLGSGCVRRGCLSMVMEGWKGGKRDHLVKFSTAGRVLTFILFGWVTFD